MLFHLHLTVVDSTFRDHPACKCITTVFIFCLRMWYIFLSIDLNGTFKIPIYIPIMFIIYILYRRFYRSQSLFLYTFIYIFFYNLSIRWSHRHLPVGRNALCSHQRLFTSRISMQWHGWMPRRNWRTNVPKTCRT